VIRWHRKGEHWGNPFNWRFRGFTWDSVAERCPSAIRAEVKELFNAWQAERDQEIENHMNNIMGV